MVRGAGRLKLSKSTSQNARCDVVAKQQTMTKVALYARVSTKGGRQDTENELIALREYPS
jgi:predicted site-specific integrase-resolvase